MPQSKQQKRLGALERRKRDRDWMTTHRCTCGHCQSYEQHIIDTAAADVRNLRRKLGIAEEPKP